MVALTTDSQHLRNVYGLLKSYTHTVRDEDWEHTPQYVIDIAYEYYCDWTLIAKIMLDAICFPLTEGSEEHGRGVLVWVVRLLESVTDGARHEAWYEEAETEEIIPVGEVAPSPPSTPTRGGGGAITASRRWREDACGGVRW